MLVVMAGLPASGKSAVAQSLSRRLNAVLLDKDAVRAALFNQYVDYERAQDDLCVGVMYEVASYHFTRHPGRLVLLDGRTYSRRYQIEAVKQCARACAVPLVLIECSCTPATAHRRLLSPQNQHLAADRDVSLYEKSRAAAEPILEPVLKLDTDIFSIEDCAERAEQHILSQLGA